MHALATADSTASLSVSCNALTMALVSEAAIGETHRSVITVGSRVLRAQSRSIAACFIAVRAGGRRMLVADASTPNDKD